MDDKNFSDVLADLRVHDLRDQVAALNVAIGAERLEFSKVLTEGERRRSIEEGAD